MSRSLGPPRDRQEQPRVVDRCAPAARSGGWCRTAWAGSRAGSARSSASDRRRPTRTPGMRTDPPMSRALGERHAAGRNSRARAAGGATGRALGVPRVARDPHRRAVREAGVGELGRGGLADHDRAGAEQPSTMSAESVGHVVLEGVGAQRRALARGRRQVLDRDRHAVQRRRASSPRATAARPPRASSIASSG